MPILNNASASNPEYIDCKEPHRLAGGSVSHELTFMSAGEGKARGDFIPAHHQDRANHTPKIGDFRASQHPRNHRIQPGFFYRFLVPVLEERSAGGIGEDWTRGLA